MYLRENKNIADCDANLEKFNILIIIKKLVEFGADDRDRYLEKGNKYQLHGIHLFHKSINLH